jgi:DNA polymerase/3'-5' exonuclease PolX
MTSREQATKKIEKLVADGIKTENYGLIQEAFEICYNREGEDIFMAEDPEYIMVNDEVLYFDGAFGTQPRPKY